MNIAEKITQQVKALLPAKQIEVLDFVEYLRSRTAWHDDADWSVFSLASAMQGMEEETAPYTTLPDFY